MATTTVERPHPLAKVRPLRFSSWEAWYDRWESEERFEYLLALLHCGFDVPVHSHWDVHADRVIFYLQLADHYPFYRLSDEGESTERQKALQEMREELRQKAYDVLARRFFHETEARRLPWVYAAEDPRLLPHLLWFFRLRDQESLVGGSLKNVDSRPSRDRERIVYSFALELARHAWEYNSYNRNRAQILPEARDALHAARPQMVEVLYGLRRLDLLLEEPFVNQLDLACILTLERLAFRECHLPGIRGFYGDERRTPRSVDEALLAGSQAAQVYVLLRERFRAQEEAETLQELAVREREIRQERERLAGGETL
jgi:hypothetical protein